MARPAAKLFAGHRIRQLRDRDRMTQSALARGLAVSASYLNQIEHDQRPLSPKLLARLGALFGVPADYFGDSDELRQLQALREIMGDPLFGPAGVPAAELQAAVRAAPSLAGQVVHLYRAYLAGREQGTLPTLGPGTRPVPEAVAPYEAVGDWVQAERNYFDGIDRAAEDRARALDLAGLGPVEAMIRHLRDRHGLAVQDGDLAEHGVMWRLDRRQGRLLLARGAPAESRAFWMAQVVAQAEDGARFDRVIRRSPLMTADARALARVGLVNYYAGALMMPYDRFRAAAHDSRHDIERLQHQFGASFEQVCHRLSTLQGPGREGVPFYFLKTDIAGNVLKSSSANSFRLSRFGGPCPLWNVFRAFGMPGQISVQLSRTTDDALYLNVARTVGHAGQSYFDRPRLVAVVLGCAVSDARDMVYATGLALGDPRIAVPIGPGCRGCDRVDCRHRAVPAIGQPLDVGSEERGVVPYRIGSHRPGGRLA